MSQLTYPMGTAQIDAKPAVTKGLKGVGTAIVTPFDADLKVDLESLGRLVDAQLAGGVDFLVPVGTTGECPTLTHEEHELVIKFVVERVAGRVPVVAGTGSNNTQEAISLTRFAKKVSPSLLK